MSDEKTAQEIVVDTLSGIAGMLSEANRTPKTHHTLIVRLSVWRKITRAVDLDDYPQMGGSLTTDEWGTVLDGIEESLDIDEILHEPEECDAGECRALKKVRG